MRVSKYADILSDVDRLKNALAKSRTMRELLEELEIAHGGGNVERVKKAVLAAGLLLPNGMEVRAGRIAKLRGVPDNLVFVENSAYGRGNNRDLKQRLRSLGVPNICAMPGCPNPEPIWNGRPITLQLDHINGISNDNRLENLRLLCPNCHTQTETYGGRNARSGKTSIDWPSDDVLLEEFKLLGPMALSKKYSCHYSTVSHRIRKIKGRNLSTWNGDHIQVNS